MKYLVILTNQFPYQWREQYVAHELVALARQFDKVFIYPHDHYQKKDVIRFDLPKGVEVIDLNRQIVSAARHKVVFSFLGAFIGELLCAKRKWYRLKA